MLKAEIEALRIETVAVIRVARESEELKVSAVNAELSQLRNKIQKRDLKTAEMKRMNEHRIAELTAPFMKAMKTITNTNGSEEIKAKMKVEITQLKNTSNESQRKSAQMKQIMKTQKAEIDLLRIKSLNLAQINLTQKLETCGSHEVGAESERAKVAEKLNATSKLWKKANEFEHEIEIDLREYFVGDNSVEVSATTQVTDMDSQIRNETHAAVQLWDDGASLVTLPVGVHSDMDVVIPQKQQYDLLTASKEGALVIELHTERELLQTKLREFEQRAEVEEELALQNLQAYIKARETEASFRKESFKVQFQEHANRIAILDEQLSTMRSDFGLYIV